MVDARRDEIIARAAPHRRLTGELSPEDQRIRDLWGPRPPPSQLLDAAPTSASSSGQSDRFRAGLERSGFWQAHIAATFSSSVCRHSWPCCPRRIVVQPCGVFQGWRCRPVAVHALDRASLHAHRQRSGRAYGSLPLHRGRGANCCRITTALLGTWPLALTAYNHGPPACAVRKAMGTDDIVRIVRHHKSPSFRIRLAQLLCFVSRRARDR